MPGAFHDVPAMFAKWGMDKEPQECVWVVAYDASMTVRTVVEVARGSHVRADIHLPTMLAAILVTGCERFMLVHNHPTNRVTPSEGDKVMTKEILQATNACGLYMEDHIILTPKGAWYSFAQHGLIQTVDYIATTGASYR